MMDIHQIEETYDEARARSLRQDVTSLRGAIRNYSTTEYETDYSEHSEEDSETISFFRSWARDLWVIGSHVLIRSDRTHYSIQIIQLLSQYGSGWISIDPTKISVHGPLRRSLTFLHSHGFIRMDVPRSRIRLKGINLTKAIQMTFRFDQMCDLEMIQEFLRLLITPTQLVTLPRLIGLTSTLRLALVQPEFKLTQEFQPFFDQWVREMFVMLEHPRHELNESHNHVVSVGIKMYEGVRSFPFRALEIHFLLIQMLRSRSRSGSRTSNNGKNIGSRSDSEDGTGAKDNLDLLMSKAMTYIHLLETTVVSIIVNQIIDANQEVQPDVGQHQNNLNEHSVFEMLRDCVAVTARMRKFTLTLTSCITPGMNEILEQLIPFFMSGWNLWKLLECADLNPHGQGELIGSAFFGGIIDCLNKQGKMDLILSFVKETKLYLNQLPPADQFKSFFPELVLAHALSLGPECAHEKENILLELRSYLMGIFRAQDIPDRGNQEHEYRSGYSAGVLPHLFNCLAHLSRYETLHGIITDLKSHLQTLGTLTHNTLHRIEPYVNLPSALVASVKDKDFPFKKALLEETFGLAKRLVTMTWDLVNFENARKIESDPMGGLITFCFQTGMVREFSKFLVELEIFIMYKYGENRLEPITTTILYLEKRATDGLERVGPTKTTNCDWSEFLKKVKCSVREFTNLISRPIHVPEKFLDEWSSGFNY